MKVIFNYPRVLNLPSAADGAKAVRKLFQKGPLPQEVSDKLADDWFFKAQVKAGAISIVPAEIAASKDEKPKAANAAAAPSQPQKAKAAAG